MIIISMIACSLALAIIYFFLKSNIFVYQEKRKNSILDEINREIQNIDELQKLMLKSSRELANLQSQEAVTIENVTMMKKNNYQAILNRKEKLRKQYESLYQRKFDVMRRDIMERIILDILKTVDHNDHELIANIRHAIEQID